MSARISKMYKDSGGCNTEHKCKECRYFTESKITPKTYICKHHGEEDTLWKGAWYSCKGFRKPIKKRKPKTKLKEEATGQLQMVLS